MTDQTRRSVLKTLAYGTVLSTGVISSLAFAKAINPSSTTKSEAVQNMASSAGLTTQSGVTVFQQGTGLNQNVSLMNLSDETVYLHPMQPISVENIEGSSCIKVNTVNHSDVVLEAGQRVSFELFNQSPALASISSEHPAFNGAVLSS